MYFQQHTTNLPEPFALGEYEGNIPEPSPCLIDGILRKGHKLLIAGPSKAGKTWLLIYLCIAIAESLLFFGHQCAKGKVLYVNLEIDKNSIVRRFFDVYEELNLASKSLSNIIVWNLRGCTLTLDELAPLIISATKDQGFSAIVIDPIYKISTGDENSATEIGRFCNLFDRIATETGCSVIYSHHHSKGAQGNKKAMDRSSGSGVFARDPDAVLDLSELEVKREVLEKLGASSAWRIEGVLREFPPFDPINCFFKYPIHILDTDGDLDCARIFDGAKSKEMVRDEHNKALERAYSRHTNGDSAPLREVAKELCITERTAREWVKDSGEFYVRSSAVHRNS